MNLNTCMYVYLWINIGFKSNRGMWVFTKEKWWKQKHGNGNHGIE
jgi:hypothetical protein